MRGLYKLYTKHCIVFNIQEKNIISGKGKGSWISVISVI
jgi:hypothetical protein